MYVEKKLVPQHLVIFRDPNETFSLSLSDALIRQFSEDRYQTPIIENFKTADKDKDGFTQHIQDVLTKYHPDFLFIPTNAPTDVTTLLNAIPPTQEYAKLKVFVGSAGYELVQTGAAFTGYTRMLISSSAFPDEWSLLAPGKPLPSFFKEYPAIYDPYNLHPQSYTYSRVNSQAMLAYDAVYAFLVASGMTIQQGGTPIPKPNPTAEDIKNALTQIKDSRSFQGITGVISFGSDGNPINKIHFLLHVVDGGYVHVAAYQGCFLVNSTCDNNINIVE